MVLSFPNIFQELFTGCIWKINVTDFRNGIFISANKFTLNLPRWALKKYISRHCGESLIITALTRGLFLSMPKARRRLPYCLYSRTDCSLWFYIYWLLHAKTKIGENKERQQRSWERVSGGYIFLFQDVTTACISFTALPAVIGTLLFVSTLNNMRYYRSGPWFSSGKFWKHLHWQGYVHHNESCSLMWKTEDIDFSGIKLHRSSCGDKEQVSSHTVYWPGSQFPT